VIKIECRESVYSVLQISQSFKAFSSLLLFPALALDAVEGQSIRVLGEAREEREAIATVHRTPAIIEQLRVVDINII